MPSVSVVIPCYNPLPCLREAIASARAQTYGPVEVVLVNDGTGAADSLALLKATAGNVDRYIEQPNRGLPAARNAGFRAVRSEFVVPLDADDTLDPDYIQVCLRAAADHPEAAFVYTDYRVFGDRKYVERTPEFNLYHLLDRNVLTYAALIRRADWEACGGYDDSMTRGYEDWEFWLGLGALGRYGRRAPGVLFNYRKHGPSLLDIARRHHSEIVAYIRSKHPNLYSSAARARVKARWEPAVCIVGAPAEQTLEDCAFVDRPEDAPADARAFLLPAAGSPLDPHSGEYAALAVWGGRNSLRLPDGSTAHSRDQSPGGLPAGPRHHAVPTGRLGKIYRHLLNAEILSLDAWLRHPLGSAVRFLPLRFKERINRLAGRPVFDLTFYLQFQPSATVLAGNVVEPLVYYPRADPTRRRVALATPHLGPGGAEAVLLEVAAALGRREFEVLLIAAQSHDLRWLDRWRKAADHIYDLSSLVARENIPAALLSVVRNWRPEAVLIQNTALAYAAIPELRKALPGTRLLDLIHSVDEAWDIVAATSAVADCLDVRVAVSDAVRQRLLEAGRSSNTIAVARNGVDLARFAAGPSPSAGPHRILFAGRLDPVKRPLLLADLALELSRVDPSLDFRVLVAGDGPEAAALQRRVERLGVAPRFDFRGHAPDVAPLLAECDLLVLPSRSEGVPLVILEAFAASRPVVASAVGGIPEVVTDATGVLVPRGPDEVAAFAIAIAGLLRNPDRRRALGENGRWLVEREYSRETARARYRALF